VLLVNRFKTNNKPVANETSFKKVSSRLGDIPNFSFSLAQNFSPSNRDICIDNERPIYTAYQFAILFFTFIWLGLK